jgi:uncharacterized membrane protein YphA (DoxX/SURF4 family)
MTAFVLIARLLLAGVFAVAGLAKLADRSGSRQAVTGFGLPSSLAGSLSILLPLAELAVAAALIPTSTALWGAIGALALLLVFLVGIGINLARGRKPDCHCFGQLHSAPAGWKTLVPFAWGSIFMFRALLKPIMALKVPPLRMLTCTPPVGMSAVVTS